MHKKIFFTLVSLLVQAHLHAAHVKTAVQTEQDILQLTLAAESGNLERLQVLVESGANIHAQDASGWNALDWALHAGQSDIILYLLDREVRTKQSHVHINNFLHKKNVQMLDFLANDMRIEVAASQVFDPFLTCVNKFPAYLESFIQGICLRRAFEIDTSFMMTAKNDISLEGSLLLFAVLLCKKCPENSKLAIKLLLKHGADKKMKNKNNQCAIDWAKKLDCKDKEILDLLS